MVKDKQEQTNAQIEPKKANQKKKERKKKERNNRISYHYLFNQIKHQRKLTEFLFSFLELNLLLYLLSSSTPDSSITILAVVAPL